MEKILSNLVDVLKNIVVDINQNLWFLTINAVVGEENGN